jgi:hypothetical protein
MCPAGTPDVACKGGPLLTTSLDFFSNGLLDFLWWQPLLATLISTHVTIISVTVSRDERLLLMRGVKRWFRDDPEGQDNQDGRRLAQIYDRNRKLRTYVELREDLSAIWERSNASGEQLLSHCRTGVCEPSRVKSTRSRKFRCGFANMPDRRSSTPCLARGTAIARTA